MADGIDWPSVQAEALDIFVRYLRIDSSNPPGNEAEAARFLYGLIEAEGIDCELFESAPNRAFVIARLRAGSVAGSTMGDGSAGALMLCNHTDVVPVEEQYWDLPPFAATVRDGRVYARGAVDMKGAGVMQLIALLLVKRQGLVLKRDLTLRRRPRRGGRQPLGHGVALRAPPGRGRRRVRDLRGWRRPAGLRRAGDASVRRGDEREGDLLVAHQRGGHAGPRQPSARGQLRRASDARAAAAARLGPRGLTFTPETHAYLDRLADAGLVAIARRPRGRRRGDPELPRYARHVPQHAQRHDVRQWHQGERDPGAERGRDRLPPAARPVARRVAPPGDRTHRRPAHRGRVSRGDRRGAPGRRRVGHGTLPHDRVGGHLGDGGRDRGGRT